MMNPILKYSKTCFARSLVFSIENGRKREVLALEKRGKTDIKFKELQKRFHKVA